MNLESTKMLAWARELFPIGRSLSGEGTRQTLRYLQDLLPGLQIHSVASGEAAFDWTVPEEWNVRDAYVADLEGRRLIDFKAHNLHLLGYSEPVDEEMTVAELDKRLYSLPDQPTAIPYVTSYYKRRWGFCVSHEQRLELLKTPDMRVRVRIDSTLGPGTLNYGEYVVPGSTDREIFFSTYVCHPSMANNELSGPVVSAALAQHVRDRMPERRFTYRFVFLPETIGSIVYLSRNLQALKERMVAGFVVTCVGDDRTYSFVESRKGGTLADRVALHALRHHYPEFKKYSFLERGSDERQYCSPGVDLPVCSICRSKYGEYPEYHTSLDDFGLVSASGLQGAFDAYVKCIRILEANRAYRTAVLCEPQLGKRGLYPTISTKETAKLTRNMMNFLAYADGTQDLIGLAEKIGANALDLIPFVERFRAENLVKAED